MSEHTFVIWDRPLSRDVFALIVLRYELGVDGRPVRSEHLRPDGWHEHDEGTAGAIEPALEVPGILAWSLQKATGTTKEEMLQGLLDQLAAVSARVGTLIDAGSQGARFNP